MQSWHLRLGLLSTSYIMLALQGDKKEALSCLAALKETQTSILHMITMY